MRDVRSSERGASVAMMAVSLFALLGMVALAVDLGMLLKVRSDAQRAADAAALAGAAEFLDGLAADKKDEAADSALHYSARNYVGWQYVDTTGAITTDSGARWVINSPESYIQVMPDSEKVRVFIRRAATATWFGNLLGLDFVAVSAKAAAKASYAGAGKCVKPFAIPDIWSDLDNDTDPINPGNKLPDIVGTQGDQGGEDWRFDGTVGDSYQRGDPQNPNAGTGYGSGFRNGMDSWYTNDQTLQRRYWNDYGRPMPIKMSNPMESPSPGYFYPWTMPYDSAHPEAYGNQDYNAGADWYRWNIANCNPSSVAVLDTVPQDTTYLNKPGNMIGPTFQGIQDLMNQDSLACWDEVDHPAKGSPYKYGYVKQRLPGSSLCSETYASWENSPRVVMVPLFDPSQIRSGRTSLEFNNIAVIFLEGQKNPHEPVMARFMYFAKGTGPGTGTLIKKLQLVE
ncbi:MAG: pilus assembly protein TadG-related protein [Gemmatimonadales bacterium]